MSSISVASVFLIAVMLMFCAAFAATDVCDCMQSGGINGECYYFTEGKACSSHPCQPSWQCVEGPQATGKCIRRIVLEKIVPTTNGGCEREPVQDGSILVPYVQNEPETGVCPNGGYSNSPTNAKYCCPSDSCETSCGGTGCGDKDFNSGGSEKCCRDQIKADCRSGQLPCLL